MRRWKVVSIIVQYAINARAKQNKRRIMKVFKSKLYKISSKIDEFFCLTSANCKVEDGVVTYEEVGVNFFYFLRFIAIISIATYARLPRYALYFSRPYIVRIVYLLATFLDYIYFLSEFFTNIRCRKQIVNNSNEFIKIFCEFKREGDGPYVRKRLFTEIGIVTFVSLILVHLDYMRGIVSDFFGYTIIEIMMLKSIFRKVFMLTMILRAFKNINDKIAEVNPIHIININNFYKKLQLVAMEVNSFNNVSYLVLSMKTFIFITYNMYKLIIFYQNSSKFPSPNIILSWYLTAVWTPLYILHLYVIISCCDEIESSIKKFKQILNKKFCNFKKSDEKLYGRLVSFEVQNKLMILLKL